MAPSMIYATMRGGPLRSSPAERARSYEYLLSVASEKAIAVMAMLYEQFCAKANQESTC
jgi:hypothetical protein